MSHSVRLVGGSEASEGRVEVFIDQEWSTVCDNSWDVFDADVICRELGFEVNKIIYVFTLRFLRYYFTVGSCSDAIRINAAIRIRLPLETLKEEIFLTCE